MTDDDDGRRWRTTDDGRRPFCSCSFNFHNNIVFIKIWFVVDLYFKKAPAAEMLLSLLWFLHWESTNICFVSIVRPLAGNCFHFWNTIIEVHQSCISKSKTSCRRQEFGCHTRDEDGEIIMFMNPTSISLNWAILTFYSSIRKNANQHYISKSTKVFFRFVK